MGPHTCCWSLWSTVGKRDYAVELATSVRALNLVGLHQKPGGLFIKISTVFDLVVSHMPSSKVQLRLVRFLLSVLFITRCHKAATAEVFGQLLFYALFNRSLWGWKSGDSEPSLSYAVIDWGCWGTSPSSPLSIHWYATFAFILLTVFPPSPASPSPSAGIPGLGAVYFQDAVAVRTNLPVLLLFLVLVLCSQLFFSVSKHPKQSSLLGMAARLLEVSSVKEIFLFSCLNRVV